MGYSADFLKTFSTKYQHQSEYVEAVEEFVESLSSLLDQEPQYAKIKILERLTQPDRIIQFRVVWMDSNALPQVNTGYRVQFSSLLGPYKGGLRFHPSVNLSILKFLGFEQTMKNSLSGLWLGGAKGGSDFDPKGKTDAEIMRFCQSFMTELAKHIGPETDIPAGDIGVGTREIGYMFGWYKKLTNEFHGSITGKATDWGGSSLRPESTGYGLMYFINSMLEHNGQKLSGKSVVISGSGNVAQFATKKAIELGAKVLTMSDSAGYIYDSAGIDNQKLEVVQDIKNNQHGRIKEYIKHYPEAKYFEGEKPWKQKAEIYAPCATQDEIDDLDAKLIVEHKPLIVGEGANMPSTKEAIKIFNQAGINFGPSKACNAGGVAISNLEMAQNSSRIILSYEYIDTKLKEIMNSIHGRCVEYGEKGGKIDYSKGANHYAFKRVSEALINQGLT